MFVHELQVLISAAWNSEYSESWQALIGLTGSYHGMRSSSTTGEQAQYTSV